MSKALEKQVEAARKLVFRDGYDMSFGEIASLYERGEIIVQPEYQRLFRWDDSQKTRFVESILLNIPIPPIFVFARPNGHWELVDGLQRVSTVLQLMGLLKDEDGKKVEPYICEGTRLLPDLAGKAWTDGNSALSETLQIAIKRARIRVEILSQQTEDRIKFELFQRLNTGGSNLSEQEVRNCVIFELNKSALTTIRKMSEYPDFADLVRTGEEKKARAFNEELVVRFLVYRNFLYNKKLDVHEFLDDGVIEICRDANFDWKKERGIFEETMSFLKESTGNDVFWKSGRFSLAYYEFISLGVSKALEKKPRKLTGAIAKKKVADIANMPEANKYIGAGIRGTHRLSRFVFPKAIKHFK